MICKDCGEQLDGDGYKRVLRCPNGPESGEGSGEFAAPDEGPFYCGFTDAPNEKEESHDNPS